MGNDNGVTGKGFMVNALTADVTMDDVPTLADAG
jgi:hypothetical protein